ncbi:pyridoxal phosphate-dependent transferase [Roridomyces roridus]|uniref:5-aminolevulinate synthase, mitochondrial n=1 Tax=Roridomyces roridus TaxID=1738132 RepID=A0AAD7C445_9AGAR|nr:pyridoxal phosphate-dependent transferase [Roridomyces roridus]
MDKLSTLTRFKASCPFLGRTQTATLRTLCTNASPRFPSISVLTEAGHQEMVAGYASVAGVNDVAQIHKEQGVKVPAGATIEMCPHASAARAAARVANDLASAASKKVESAKAAAAAGCPFHKAGAAIPVDHPPVPKAAAATGAGFNYEGFYVNELDKKHQDKSYRYFNNINRLASRFPIAHTSDVKDEVQVWCSNDYLGMGSNPVVVETMHRTLDKYGHGAGGTRNIAGNGAMHLGLEQELASLHRKQAALVFSSCYVANDATLSTLGTKLPGCVFFSDTMNHASMIQGMRHSPAKRVLFKHNDMADLESKLAQYPKDTPKIIAFESVYSMCGSIGPIKEICDLAEKYGALTFLDEVHAVGLYGPRGAGVAEHLDYDAHKAAGNSPHAIKGTVMDRHMARLAATLPASDDFVDMIRSYAPGFIFTTSLPPVTVAGAQASVVYQKEYVGDRQLKQVNVREVKRRFAAIDIPVVPGPSHIVPVLVGDAALAKAASDKLLAEHNIYVQSINYPTVARGEERLRITVTQRHTREQMDILIGAVDKVFTDLKINRTSDWVLAGGRAGVGLGAVEPEPMWNDEQLGLGTPAAPRTLRDGERSIVDAAAVNVARAAFSTLLGPVTPAAVKGNNVKAIDGKALVGIKLRTGGSARIDASIPVPPPDVPATAA